MPGTLVDSVSHASTAKDTYVSPYLVGPCAAQTKDEGVG